jgi:hypothetical protein
MKTIIKDMLWLNVWNEIEKEVRKQVDEKIMGQVGRDIESKISDCFYLIASEIRKEIYNKYF